MKKNIAIIAGGDSSESVISLQSAETMKQVIDTEKYNVHTILVKDGQWTLVDPEYNGTPINKNDFSLSVNSYSRTKFDCAFIGIHGTPGEDGKMQGYFDLVDMPYTTGGVMNMALTFNKYYCSQYLRNFDIKVAKSTLVRKGDEIRTTGIVEITGLPCFVKPNAGGSSFGISKVKTINDLKAAIEKAFTESDEVVIEEFIEGIEVTSGLIKTADREIVFPITEIVSKNEFFDFEAKYNAEQSTEITPARIDDEIAVNVKHLSSLIYDLVNCRGVVRIDYIIKGQSIYFLEVNTVPGMSKNSIIPKQVKEMGLELKDIYTLMIEDAIDNRRKS